MEYSTDLTPKQRAFVELYMQYGNATRAYKEAGYKQGPTDSATSNKAQNLMQKDVIRLEIKRLQEERSFKNIVTSQQVMQFLSDVMNGKVLDQFGLETSVADRIKAAQELAKRTVDIDNKVAGIADNVVQIKLDWGDDVDTV